MNLHERFGDLEPTSGTSSWRSPANIAFVKYWGKKGHQLPANPSVSMTLKECVTETKVTVAPTDTLQVELFLGGQKEERFGMKIRTFLEHLATEIPVLNQLSFVIETQNNFPHGAGIASSASGLSAFALCLTDFLCGGKTQTKEYVQIASSIARLASGSACRSVYGGFAMWGESFLPGSSDLFAIPVEVHPELQHLCDLVMIVSEKEKTVSSRQGHARMGTHAFADARYTQARDNFRETMNALVAGDMEKLGAILEKEALALHAMMMTAPEPFTLLKPHTLTGMELVREFRRETNIPLYFTLDAGPNLHLIYPEPFRKQVHSFAQSELKPFTVSFIDDETGPGPSRC